MNYHSITFGNKNTWTDWHLVPSSRPVINPPKPKTQYVDIPGADGSIDLTESLAGRPVFSDREGSLDFIVLNDFNVDNYNYNWIEVYTEIMQYLHGQRMRMVLEDDPNYYYDGRFEVNSWKSDQNNSTITIDYHLSPYKYRLSDIFEASDFESGVLDESGIKGGPNYNIVEEPSDYGIRLITPRTYSKGDIVQIGKNYQIDIAMYDGTLDSYTAKDFIWSTYLTRKMYTFTDSGVYRIAIKKYNSVVTQDDYALMASEVHIFSGGSL